MAFDMPSSLLARRVAALYGHPRILAGGTLRDVFGAGDLDWVYAHPPALSDLMRLLAHPTQQATPPRTH